MRKRIQALGRLKTGQMNKTESAYCQHLEQRKRAGEIAFDVSVQGYQAAVVITRFYTPDFAVMLATSEWNCTKWVSGPTTPGENQEDRHQIIIRSE